jgi:hypothetical protein
MKFAGTINPKFLIGLKKYKILIIINLRTHLAYHILNEMHLMILIKFFKQSFTIL